MAPTRTTNTERPMQNLDKKHLMACLTRNPPDNKAPTNNQYFILKT